VLAREENKRRGRGETVFEKPLNRFPFFVYFLMNTLLRGN